MTLRYSFSKVSLAVSLVRFLVVKMMLLSLSPFVIDGLHGGEGDKGQAALVSLVFVQSDYPVGYTACIDKPADWFRT
mgnify:CR=1 FL=1